MNTEPVAREFNLARSTPLLIAVFLSGASALVYETVWTRSFSIILGSTVEAASATFAAFLVGLAIGAWLIGRRSPPLRYTLHAYIAGQGVKWGYGDRIDLYPFEDEQTASDIAGDIPPDASCSGSADFVVELPYFQCGSVIAFVNQPNEQLQTTFEELCGPPFARTRAFFQDPKLFIPSD